GNCIRVDINLPPPEAARPCSARDHRAERLASEQVDMEVRYFLAAIGSDVRQQPVTWLDQALLARDMANRADEAGDLFRARPRGKIVPAHVSTLRDHQHVHRRLRCDIVEGERPLVLVDLLARDISAQDFSEYVVGIVRLRGVDRHQALRAAFSARPDVPSRLSSSASTSASDTSLAASSTIR